MLWKVKPQVRGNYCAAIMEGKMQAVTEQKVACNILKGLTVPSMSTRVDEKLFFALGEI